VSRTGTNFHYSYLIIITDISGVPEPDITPWSASSANVKYAAQVRNEQKAAAKGQVTNAKVWESFSSLESTMNTGFDRLISAVNNISTPFLSTT